MAVIRVKFDNQAKRWCAWFDDRQGLVGLAELPDAAVNRLLKTTRSPSGRFVVHSDRDFAGTGIVIRIAIWHPPRVRYLCPTCEGRPPRPDHCPTCNGRGTLPR